MPTISKEQMADSILSFCVSERSVEPGHVAMFDWFHQPVAKLEALGLADMALFNEAVSYAIEQGWIESVYQIMFRVTQAGYLHALSLEGSWHASTDAGHCPPPTIQTTQLPAVATRRRYAE